MTDPRLKRIVQQLRPMLEVLRRIETDPTVSPSDQMLARQLGESMEVLPIIVETHGFTEQLFALGLVTP